MIDEFVKQHDKPSHCYKNTYCNGLNLRNITFKLEGGSDGDEDLEYHDAEIGQVSNSPVRSQVLQVRPSHVLMDSQLNKCF
jgi:hypothetical protein